MFYSNKATALRDFLDVAIEPQRCHIIIITRNDAPSECEPKF